MANKLENKCSVKNMTKGKLPSLPFVKIKNAVLGNGYDLSVVFVTSNKIRTLNHIYRKIDKPTDILSFPISKSAGEIFICLTEAKKESRKFDRNPENFLGFLLIHGLAHLKGLVHSSRMEREEQKFRKQFKI